MTVNARSTDLASLWMPFTPNRRFKAQPRMIERATGCHYVLEDGRRLFDSISGLWCSPLGHGHRRIVEAVQRQLVEVDYSPAFQMGYRPAFDLAARIAAFAGRPDDKVFFTNSGSEAVDTALKIAVGYHRARGDAARTRLIGRERGYHGVGIGGISVGGIVPNRRAFSSMMIPGVDHLPHTYNRAETAFTRGQPAWGAHLADDLERLIALHDASTIAAVIVEPVAGSTGVLPPPIGYLERLRDICTRHGILLIFDEVITGFGRLGVPFAADAFAVCPDMLTFAKAVTNAVIPLGGVIVSPQIHDAFMSGPDHLIELAHGYTYSGHPMAMAAGHAALDALTTDGLIARAATLAPLLADAMHSLQGTPGVVDVRSIGLMAAIDLDPIAGKPGLRGTQVFEAALDQGLYIRLTGDTLAVAPPFVAEESDIQQIAPQIMAAIAAAG